MQTVASTVNITTFAHIENAHFAIPRRNRITPNLQSLTTTTFGVQGQLESNIRADAEAFYRKNHEPNDIPQAQIGGVPTTTVDETQKATDTVVLPAALCQGEVHTSLRQALKRFNFVGTYVAGVNTVPPPATPTFCSSTGNYFVIRPWAATFAPPSAFPIGAVDGNNFYLVGTDLFSQAYSMYSFYRGSMRLRVQFNVSLENGLFREPVSIFITYPPDKKPNTSGTNYKEQFVAVYPSNPIVNRLYDRNSAGSPATPAAGRQLFWESVQFPDKQGFVEFEVPYYSTSHMSTALYPQYNGDEWLAQRNGLLPLPIVIVGSQNLNAYASAKITVFRAVGDDFSFGGLTGVLRATVPRIEYPNVSGADRYGNDAAVDLPGAADPSLPPGAP